MKDYSKMSDFEINKEVATLMCGSECVVGHAQRKVIITTGIAGYVLCHFDPCNNPSDAWPIIHGNDIMLNPNCADELWKAEQGFREKPSGFYDVATAYNKNPLRAAMIVYLMMKDEEK